jgi:hypothetical protein
MTPMLAFWLCWGAVVVIALTFGISETAANAKLRASRKHLAQLWLLVAGCLGLASLAWAMGPLGG